MILFVEAICHLQEPVAMKKWSDKKGSIEDLRILHFFAILRNVD